jgi:hypothetical protein
MSAIQRSNPPPSAFIHKYTAMPGAYVDCYSTEISIQLSFTEYLLAFYTTPLFKMERLILLLVRKPSTDEEAQQLAEGKRDAFAAWTVEARAETQILMCDFAGSTRSWLMVVPVEHGTRLYFGSAVVPHRVSKDGTPSLGFFFNALLGFHKIYSVLLLYSARQKILRQK